MGQPIPMSESPVWPSYIQNFHHDIMTGDRSGADCPYNVKDYLASALSAGSPYAGAIAYDPNDELDAMATRYETWQSYFADFTPDEYSDFMTTAKGLVESAFPTTAEYEGFLSSVKTLMDTEFPDALAYTDYISTAKAAIDAAFGTTHIDAAVDAYAEKQAAKLYGALNSYAAGLFDVRAIEGDLQFAIGHALILRDHQREVGEFRANLTLQNENNKMQMVVQAASELLREFLTKREMKKQMVFQAATEMLREHLTKTSATKTFTYQSISELLRMRMARIDMEKTAASMDNDVHLRRIVANKDYYADELAIAEADWTSDLELFRYGENMLHALSGVATVPPKLPRGASALSTMAAGAGTALQIGSGIGGEFGIAAGLVSMLLMGAAGWSQGY